jgi:hypothetical protein
VERALLIGLPALMGGLMINNVLRTASTTADLRRKLTSSTKRTGAGADRIANAHDGTDASFTDTLAAAQQGGFELADVETATTRLDDEHTRCDAMSRSRWNVTGMSVSAPGLSNLRGGLGPIGTPVRSGCARSTDRGAAALKAECATDVVGAGVVRFRDDPPRIAGSFPSDLPLAAALEQGALLPGALAESPVVGLAGRVLNQLLATVADR